MSSSDDRLSMGIAAYLETEAGQAELVKHQAALAKEREALVALQTRTNEGWEFLNSLTFRDDDQVLKAVGILACGCDNGSIKKPVPFNKIGEKLKALGYLPYEKIDQKTRITASDEDGISEDHKQALASCIVANYMHTPTTVIPSLVEKYFKRFPVSERPTKKTDLNISTDNRPG